MPTDFTSVTAAAPANTSGQLLQGSGWTLDLASGWHVEDRDPTVMLFKGNNRNKDRLTSLCGSCARIILFSDCVDHV